MLSVIAQCGLSLVDEAGKIVARKLLGNDKKKVFLNGYELDRKSLSLGEAELEKVIKQSFNVEETFLMDFMEQLREDLQHF